MSDWMSQQERELGDNAPDDNWDDLTLEEQFQAADECPECEGLGLVPVGFDEDAYENIEGDCWRCKGDGRYHTVIEAK
jgi:hypothetical protein